MAFILNLETSTEICSVAIGKADQLLCLEEIEQPYQHASQITLLINKCLENTGLSLNEITAVAISGGPGSFTGLRIGASIAKGITYALDKPLIAVDTLQALAYAARKSRKNNNKVLYAPMIDARRMEVYTGLYNSDLKSIVSPHALILQEDAFSQWLDEDFKIILSGNGVEKSKTVLRHPNITFQPSNCSAQNMVELAYQSFSKESFENPAYFAPLYLKPPNITKPKKIF